MCGRDCSTLVLQVYRPVVKCLETSVLYRTRGLDRSVHTSRVLGARSIKPFERSRSRGGRGPMEIQWREEAVCRWAGTARPGTAGILGRGNSDVRAKLSRREG